MSLGDYGAYTRVLGVEVERSGYTSSSRRVLNLSLYLVATSVFVIYTSSPNTNQTFMIKSHITCQTANLIYVIYNKICPGVLYVDYTVDDMRVRWRNHKSHIMIKRGVNSCEIATNLATHFIR